MATLEQVAIRRTDAIARIEKAVRKITKATDADVSEYPAQHKQPEMRSAVEAEWLADSLEAVAAKVVRLSDAKAIEAELAAVTGERDSAMEAATAVKQADEQDAAVRDAMRRLVGLVATDDVVRFALTKAGFAQAKQDDGGGDWSVSIAGLGPDLDAMDAATKPEQPAAPSKATTKSKSS